MPGESRRRLKFGSCAMTPTEPMIAKGAAREIGREPVQYVAKIYKYYLAYKMSGMQILQRQATRDDVGIE